MNTKPLSILIVDDSQDDADIFKKLLNRSKPNGYHIIHSSTAKDAYQALDKNEFDCVLIDYMLSQTNGLDFIRQIREAGNDVSVIAVSGSGNEQIAVEALKLGAQYYLSKKILESSLLEIAIENAINETRFKRKTEEKNKELKEFTQVAAHDLQAPLRRIQMFSRFLVDDVKSNSVEDVESDVNAILSSVDNMQSLLNSLVEFTRIGRSATDHSPVSLRGVVDKALENLEVDIKNKNASVIWDEEKMPIIYGHESALIQLFQNLISNSIKFNQSEAPHVKIELENQKEKHKFSILDNGIGIDETQFNKIFSPLCKLNLQKDYAGSGIGLATCKRVVEQHEGEIWVDSTPGNGSVFHLTLNAFENDNLTPKLKINRPA